MSRPSRRRNVHPQQQQQSQFQPQEYAVVPNQSPPRLRRTSHQTTDQYQSHQQPQPPPRYGPGPPNTRSPSTSSNRHSSGASGRGAVAMGVATGQIGAGYGPYSYNPNQTMHANSRFKATPLSENPAPALSPSNEKHSLPRSSAPTNAAPDYVQWSKDPDFDDFIHNPDPRTGGTSSEFTIFSARGWTNVGGLMVIVLGLLTLFGGYPIIYYSHLPPPIKGYNVGGINGTGQIPILPNLPKLIDTETPDSAKTRVGSDGKRYVLAFSDEFNTEGRSFYPGDDPYWEAADLHYWATGDLEWYDPSAITTEDGKLVITITEETIHGLNFKSGMLTSWNKLCFNTGYVEVSVSLPGTPLAPGFWPAVWTLGNLGRAGYGATTEGMWPYSYDSCDLGTFVNQTTAAGVPASAAYGSDNGGPISLQPGQRLSACTCPGSDHPGPKNSVGRGVPEVDILEGQVDVSTFTGEASQSFQCAPYNYKYQIDNSSQATTIYNSTVTKFNTYHGDGYQQSVSAVTAIDSKFYSGNSYAPYAYELWSDPNNRQDGYITWFSNGIKTWTATAATVGADPISQISARIIPEEPMYLIFNLGISPSFELQDYKHMQFPSKMYIDYVRVYQREGTKEGITCNPSSRPTSNYIQKHIQAYSNPNFTTWAQAGNTFPRNSLYDGC